MSITSHPIQANNLLAWIQVERSFQKSEDLEANSRPVLNVGTYDSYDFPVTAMLGLVGTISPLLLTPALRPTVKVISLRSQVRARTEGKRGLLERVKKTTDLAVRVAEIAQRAWRSSEEWEPWM